MTRDKERERGLRAFARALAFVATMAILYPLVDLVATNWPIQAGVMEWRYQFIGRTSQVVITPVVGVTLALAGAVVTRSKTGARVVSVMAYAAGAILLAMTGFFVADYGQAASQVPDSGQAVLQVAAFRAVGKNVFSVVTLAALGWAASSNARIFGAAEARTKDKSQLID